MAPINKLVRAAISRTTQYSTLAKSFMAVVCTALLVSIIYHQHSVKIITDAGEYTSLTITRTFLNSLDDNLIGFILSANDLEAEELTSHTNLAQLDRSVRRVIGGTRVEKIKIYSLSGRTLYSTEPSQIGEDQSSNQGYRSALKGTANSSLVFRDTFNSMDGLIENKDLIQTYTMVFSPSDRKRILGVFELYTDVTPLIDELESSLFQVLAVAVSILFILYGLHLWVTLRAQHLITAQGSEIENKKRALEYSRSLTESLLDSIQECILFVGPNGLVLRSNLYVKQHTTADPEGHPIARLLSDTVLGQEPNAAMQAIDKIFKQAQPQKGVLANGCMDKNRTHTMDAYPVLDVNGIPRLAILYLRDVTEERLAQEQLNRQEKLIGLGALAAGYAHDLINPLSALSSELELLELENLPDELRISINTQQELVERLKQITHKMRSAFHSSTKKEATTSVATAIKLAIQQVRHQAAGNEITIKYLVQDNLPEAPLSQESLTMVLVNILHNAIHAMPEGGNITIDAATNDFGQTRLTVADTGTGIPDEDRAQVFAPLYTTKPGGLGLGLTISNELIRVTGGRIEIYSSPGKGTTVNILLTQKRW